ncbi:hypothetical protein MLD38_014167 [Melastoma candidum]|uniref:Uncharacterized protein n=1 Tax=Melastoma candidum TaxID=119954 RepID=A0ACB9RFL4_9MYRT|nr:hypothetical protein MLD38_014167 [Melastoma candidum]
MHESGTMDSSPPPSSSSPGETQLSDIPEDLIREILVRVPPRCAVRLQTVSKLWLFIVSGREFRLRHTVLNPPVSPAAVLLCSSPFHDDLRIVPLACEATNFKTNVPLSIGAPGVLIVQSCNGLLLCRTWKTFGSSCDYYVFNPTTNQSSAVPRLAACEGRSSAAVFGLALAFDPSDSPFYKVVCVRGTDGPCRRFQIVVYSSKDRKWTNSTREFAAPFDMVFNNGVFWRGAVHWLSPSGSSLSFDIAQEDYGELPKLPARGDNSGMTGSRRFRYFGESGGHLYYFEIHGNMTARFTVFVIESDCSTWSPRYEVELDLMIRDFPEMVRKSNDPDDASNYYAFTTLLLLKRPQPSLVIHIPGKILSYDLGNKTVQNIYKVPPHEGKGHGKLHYSCLGAYEFFETLAPV